MHPVRSGGGQIRRRLSRPTARLWPLLVAPSPASACKSHSSWKRGDAAPVPISISRTPRLCIQSLGAPTAPGHYHRSLGLEAACNHYPHGWLPVRIHPPPSHPPIVEMPPPPIQSLGDSVVMPVAYATATSVYGEQVGSSSVDAAVAKQQLHGEGRQQRSSSSSSGRKGLSRPEASRHPRSRCPSQSRDWYGRPRCSFRRPQVHGRERETHLRLHRCHPQRPRHLPRNTRRLLLAPRMTSRCIGRHLVPHLRPESSQTLRGSDSRWVCRPANLQLQNLGKMIGQPLNLVVDGQESRRTKGVECGGTRGYVRRRKAAEWRLVAADVRALNNRAQRWNRIRGGRRKRL